MMGFCGAFGRFFFGGGPVCCNFGYISVVRHLPLRLGVMGVNGVGNVEGFEAFAVF